LAIGGFFVKAKRQFKESVGQVEVDGCLYRGTRTLRGGVEQTVEVRFLGTPHMAVSFRVDTARLAESTEDRVARANAAWSAVMEGRDEVEFVVVADGVQGIWEGLGRLVAPE
jgi:hypothetical protein